MQREGHNRHILRVGLDDNSENRWRRNQIHSTGKRAARNFGEVAVGRVGPNDALNICYWHVPDIRVTPSTHTVAQKVRATIALQKESQMFFDGGYTYSNFLMNVLGIFAFVVWFWLLVIIYGDLFRRHDMSGWGKAFWVIGLVVFSYLGILAYLITQGRGMAERNAQQAQQAREELRRVVGFSVADEITKLDQLKKSGAITDAEFQRLRAKLV